MRHLEFAACVVAADRALKYAVELDACQERGLVIYAAQRLRQELEYYAKVQLKREGERAR